MHSVYTFIESEHHLSGDVGITSWFFFSESNSGKAPFLSLVGGRSAGKKKKILANREKLLSVKQSIEVNVVSKQKAIDVNLTCLHVLQHMDWEAAKQQAQALDTDGDGLVSHDEILALVKECVPTRDADKDGDISHEEYLDYVKKRVTAGKK